MNYKDQIKHPKWQKKRLEILERDFYTCQLCGDRETELHIHHKKYSYNLWDVKSEYLITLCKHCHKLNHIIEKESFDIFQFDVKKIRLKDTPISIYLLSNSNFLKSYYINHQFNDEIEYNGIFEISILNDIILNLVKK